MLRRVKIADPMTYVIRKDCPDVAGLQDGLAYGGTVTIAASGLAADAVVLVALSYDEDDIVAITEHELRLHRFSATLVKYVVAGSNDVGVSEPTGILGDYGVDVDADQAWAEVDTLGTFAIGIPQATQSATAGGDGATTGGSRPACGGGGGGMCGAMGMLCLPITLLTLMSMRGRRWRR